MIPDSVTSLLLTVYSLYWGKHNDSWQCDKFITNSVYSLYWGEDDDSWQCDEERGEHGKTDEACLVEVAATEKDSW